MKKMKNLLILAIVIALPMMYINAADATADAKKAEPAKVEAKKAEPAAAKKDTGIAFPGKVSMASMTRFSVGDCNGVMGWQKASANMDTWSSNGTGYLDYPLQIQEQFSFDISFPIVSFYSMGFGMYDNLDVGYSYGINDYNAAYPNISGNGYVYNDAILGLATGNVSPDKSAYVIPRNRINFTYYNNFDIPKVMSINVSFDVRIENKLATTNKTSANFPTTGSDPYNKSVALVGPLMMAYTPQISLKGKDIAGFTWSLSFQDEIDTYPGMANTLNDPRNAATPYATAAGNMDPAGVVYAHILNISPSLEYEFLHFINIKDIKGSVFASDKCKVTLFPMSYWLPGDNENAAIDNTFTAGFKFSFWNISPSVGIYWKYNDARMDTPYACTLNGWQWIGIAAGLGVKKDNLSFQFNYTPRLNTYACGVYQLDAGAWDQTNYAGCTATSYIDTKGQAKTGVLPFIYGRAWEHAFEGTFTISF